jgi:hypothetical protein
MSSKVIDYSFDVKSIRNAIENLVNESWWRPVQVLLEAKHIEERLDSFLS